MSQMKSRNNIISSDEKQKDLNDNMMNGRFNMNGGGEQVISSTSVLAASFRDSNTQRIRDDNFRLYDSSDDEGSTEDPKQKEHNQLRTQREIDRTQRVVAQKVLEHLQFPGVGLGYGTTFAPPRSVSGSTFAAHDSCGEESGDAAGEDESRPVEGQRELVSGIENVSSGIGNVSSGIGNVSSGRERREPVSPGRRERFYEEREEALSKVRNKLAAVRFAI